jgi:hypothetical protein
MILHLRFLGFWTVFMIWYFEQNITVWTLDLLPSSGEKVGGGTYTV